MLDFLLPIWNPLIVHPIMALLRLIAQPLAGAVSPGVAAALAIIATTILLRTILLPLSLLQIRSQRKQMALQPELKALQDKYKGNREAYARAQMDLYKERGINPAAGCLPLVIQMPLLFGMYAALTQLATIGLTLDQVTPVVSQPGQIVYQATRTEQPLPLNQFVLANITVVPSGSGDVTLTVPEEDAGVSYQGTDLLSGTQSLTLPLGKTVPNTNPPNTPGGKASIYLKPGGVMSSDGTLNTNVVVQAGQPYLVQLMVNAPSIEVDSAKSEITYDPSAVSVPSDGVQTPQLQDIPFKSGFLWLPSLGEPDTFHVFGVDIPGLLLIIMTISSFLSQRMSMLAMGVDPQQQAMMKSMAFMPFIYLIFFIHTPSGLVLYWFISNLFAMVQQYFTIGLGQLGNDVQRFTGRDLQPSWGKDRMAAYAASRARPVDATTARNGHSDIKPADGSDGLPDQRRSTRQTPGKGRKRGKR